LKKSRTVTVIQVSISILDLIYVAMASLPEALSVSGI
jgi:hypothetical protein